MTGGTSLLSTSAPRGDGNDQYTHCHSQRLSDPAACDAEPVVVVFDAELWMWDARCADS
jgi:hypothetical protein